MRSRKWLMLLFAAALTLLILGLFLLSKSRREGAGEAQFTDLSMREVSGITVEERLKSHDIDPSSARITKITNPDALREQYSAIFKDAKAGHYLVETPDEIMVYDFEHDRIVARFEFRRIIVE